MPSRFYIFALKISPIRQIGLIGHQTPEAGRREDWREAELQDGRIIQRDWKDGEISRIVSGATNKQKQTNKQNSALTLQDGRSHAEKKRVESERFFIGFNKMLINRIFSGIKVSPLHSILVLLLLHLLA